MVQVRAGHQVSRTRPVNKGKTAPDKVQKVELSCPAGHVLPHKTKKGRCTTEWCALEAPAPMPGTLTVTGKAFNEPDATSLARAEDKEDVAASVRSMEVEARIAEAHRTVRRRVVGVPANIEDPEGYAQAKAVSLLPEAMAEIEYQLKYGDDKQRADMADRVLDMTGNRKRDAIAGGGQTIVLNFSPHDAPAWADRGAARMTITAEPVEKGTRIAQGPVTELAMEQTATRGEALRETERKEHAKKDALVTPEATHAEE